MTLALGIDGGGTRTRCLILNDAGEIVGFGVAGASKPDAVDVEIGTQNLRQAAQQAALACGGLAAIDTVFAGMGGIASNDDIAVIAGMIDQIGLRSGIPIGVDYDVRIALAGGLGGVPGIGLIVGTGSSCYGRNAAGESWRSGGWGFIFDDAGSGFYLGLQGCIAVIRAYDGRAPQTALTDPLLQAAGLQSVTDMMHWAYHPSLNIGKIAALAPIVLQVAETDPVAYDIVAKGCDELCTMIAAVAQKLGFSGEVPVAAAGSVIENNHLSRTLLTESLAQRVPGAYLALLVAPPVVGAAFLALQQVGITLSSDQLAALEIDG